MDSREPWQAFEAAAVERLTRLFPPPLFRVEPRSGARWTVRGRYSEVDRQVDVAVYRDEAPRPFLVVDAKHRGRAINVTHVEQFIGFVSDLGSDIGVLIAASPSSKAAESRARNDPGDIRIEVMDEEAALQYNWLERARRIFPLDWAFHAALASALRAISTNADSGLVAEALDPVPFEEWEAFVGHAMTAARTEAVAFLEWVAVEHHDHGWRFNAARHLGEMGRLSDEVRAAVIADEPDADAREELASL